MNDTKNIENLFYIYKTNNNKNQKYKKQNEEIIFVKSGTYDLGEYNKSIFLNDNYINNNKSYNNEKNKIKKSKSYKNNDNTYKRIKLNNHLNNDKLQNHLETVIETINEVSNSKIDSSNINEDNENNNSNIIINSNNNIVIKEKNENLVKTKNELTFVNEQKIQYSENTTSVLATTAVDNTKKSLYFLKSEKTD